MKILVVSDNHGDQRILEQIRNEFQNQVDAFIHCGDSELTASSPIMSGFEAVEGNNDQGKEYPSQLELLIGYTRLLVVHGDRDHVNFSLTPLLLKAQALGAQIVCYGHTHQLAVTMESGILFLNPGSISLPRGEYSSLGGTFAIIEVKEDHYIVDYYRRNCTPIAELHFEFKR